MSWFNPFSWFNNSEKRVAYNEIPDRDSYRLFANHPWTARELVRKSIKLDTEGSHYHGMLNLLANDSVGPCPVVIGQTDEERIDQEFEDRWLIFCGLNEIGSSMRLLRRAAARSGIGIGIPIIREKGDDVKLGIRVISRERLASPIDSSPEDRIYDGIEYNKNWEPIKIYLDTEESYDVDKILLWWKRKDEELLCGTPECGPALCILPSVKRYLDAMIRSAEFRASMPMSIKLDPLIWGKEAANGMATPKGKFAYEPGMVPTLPPGTTMEGIPTGNAMEDHKSLNAMVGAAARCINMPLNMAIGNSSEFNMASSQVDIGFWKSTVLIDREDFSTINHQLIKMWMEYGMTVSKVRPYFSSAVQGFIRDGGIKYALASSAVFNHPDPLKISNSQMTDLISGMTTLTREYTSQGRNARRELTREANLLGITYQEYVAILLANRTPSALQVLKLESNPQP